MPEPLRELRMEVHGLILDPSSQSPIVLLRDEAGEAILPIWIGPLEAAAISLTLEHQEVPRPLTHDLLLNTLRALGGDILKVVVTDLREGTYYAEIHLLRDGDELVLDSRPSDALALALRAERPVFVRRAVLEKAQAFTVPASSEEAEERLKRFLEELDPEELGKYTM